MLFKIFINNKSTHPYSTAGHVKIFKADGFIGAAFTTNDMEVINAGQIVATIKDILDKNMPAEAIEFSVFADVDAMETATQKLNTVRICEGLKKIATGRFTVSATTTALETKILNTVATVKKAEPEELTAAQELRNLGILGDDDDLYEDFYLDDIDDDDDEEDEDEDEDDIPGLSGFSFSKRRNNKKSSYYGKSRVWKDSNHLRRSINRHGVVVSTKSNMERDKRIIKEFLKDFIPGNKGWEKSFRSELAKRWLAVYVVSKKQLKNLERNHRNKKNSKDNKKNLKGAFGIARNILAPKNDIWYDPNR